MAACTAEEVVDHDEFLEDRCTSGDVFFAAITGMHGITEHGMPRKGGKATAIARDYLSSRTQDGINSHVNAAGKYEHYSPIMSLWGDGVTGVTEWNDFVKSDHSLTFPYTT